MSLPTAASGGRVARSVAGMSDTIPDNSYLEMGYCFNRRSSTTMHDDSVCQDIRSGGVRFLQVLATMQA